MCSCSKIKNCANWRQTKEGLDSHWLSLAWSLRKEGKRREGKEGKRREGKEGKRREAKEGEKREGKEGKRREGKEGKRWEGKRREGK